MVSIFKEKSTTAVFGLVLAAIALHAFFLNKPPAVVTEMNDGLLYYILRPLEQLNTVFLSALYYAVVLLQALRINYLFNDVRMYQKSAFTASLGYILLTALLPPWNNITAALVANSMMIWLLFRIVKLYNSAQPRTLVYNIGLIAGGMALLYYPAMFCLPVLFFALGITRPFRLNEWFVLLLGIITPAYFYGGYLFLSGNEASFHAFTGIFSLQKKFPGPVLDTSIAFGIAGVLLLAGIFNWQRQNNRMQIQVRKIWAVLFVWILLQAIVIFFIKGAWPNALLLTCVPAAAFAGGAFLNANRLMSALLFWLTVAAVICINWSLIKI